MKIHHFTLYAESIRVLAGLIGDDWLGFGGESMKVRHYQPFAVFLAAQHRRVTITSTVDFFDIMGEVYEMPIAQLDVHEGAPGFEKAMQGGHAFVHYAGQRIADVMVIRDVIDENRGDVHTWRVIKDVGIVVVLADGVLAVTQDNPHDEMLIVSLGSTFDDLKIPEVVTRWNDEIGIEYTTVRQLIPVHSLAS